jgi:hypothetical protein
MKIVDILEKAIKKEFSNYADAIEELNKLKLPFEEQQKYESLLYKLLGKEDRVFRNPSFFFPGLLNENYFPILHETIALIRDELYSVEISQHLWDKYALSPALISYFINEALSIVRMNTLSPEELASIGEAYHQVATHLESKGLKRRPKIVQEGSSKINATDINVTHIEFDEVEDE